MTQGKKSRIFKLNFLWIEQKRQQVFKDDEFIYTYFDLKSLKLITE